MSRTYKKPYRKSRRFDKSCRSNGGCSYCRDNRLYNSMRRIEATESDIEDYYNSEPFIIEGIWSDYHWLWL